ncbi:unnamed protein product [Cochlearia groenlandica]
MIQTTKTKHNFLNYFVLSLWSLLLIEVCLGQNQKSHEIKVGVVLDLQTTFSKICLTSINMSLSDFYKDHPNYRTRLAIHVRDSKEDIVEASAAALDLIKNEQVSAIIGPKTSMQAEFMIKIANKSQVPIITFSATSPLLTSINTPYFVRATLDDTYQVQAIADIIKYFGWRSVVAMYVDNELGKGMMPYLSDTLQDVKFHRSVISSNANDDQILKELYKLMTEQTRVFIVHMDSTLGSRVFRKAKEIKMVEEGYVWLLTNGMSHMIRQKDPNLETTQGMLGVKSLVPESRKLEDFQVRWERNLKKGNHPLLRDDTKPNIYALWAYDSITALAMALEKTSIKRLRYDKPSKKANTTTDLGAISVSLYGPSLLKSLSKVRFKGLTGEFKLINSQLESTSTFEIINFVEQEEKVIGLWTPRNGLENVNATKTTSFSLEPVIWPGKTSIVPRGWEVPTNGKKIKVGVPVKKGFLNFVKVDKTDPMTNATTPTGYTIDIFEATLKKLPYSVVPRYFAFESIDNYNELVKQVYDGVFDAVVGDVTITAHRSLIVDFTLPFTESGVSMLVPMKDHENKNAWVFLEPWSLDLWLTTGCFFVLIGFVVWLFEHRVNTDFRGPPHHQIGTSFWFSFSTMVFAHREKVVSNLARFVVVVWCFVMLVLTQSYTANLTSFLTVQQFQPTAINVNDLIKNGDSVGYQNGTFVKDILRGLGFQQSQLKPFASAEECNDLLSKGTSKGGISAAFDEVAYLKAILSKFCSKYAMVEPSFKTAGFGFAFPKNSPLTGDVSRAILNVTQSEEMANIENKWSMKQRDCADPKTTLSSNRLSLSSFWGLFLIAGVCLGQNQKSHEIKVGVVLDLQTTFSKICLTSINMSLSDFYKDHPNYRTRLAIHVRDSKEDIVEASAAALDLIKNEQVSAIIGPKTSMQAEFMIEIANKSQVPIITFSATSPLLTSINSPYFVRATFDDSYQVKAIAEIVKYFGWRSVVMMYVDNELGKGMMPYLYDTLQDIKFYRSVIPWNANDDQILKELYKLMTEQTRVFIVHMDSTLGSRVFRKAKEIKMLEEGYVWLLTNGMSHMIRQKDPNLETTQGMLGVKSLVPESRKLEDFLLRWERKLKKGNHPLLRDDTKPNIYALWAYDSITALAMAAEKTSTKRLGYDKPKKTLNNPTDLGAIRVSRYGPSLLKSLSKVRFKGLAGEFKLINSQLESTSTFEIINFVEQEEKVIGLWTPRNGLENVNATKTTSFSLEPVIWPGKTSIVPRGWEFPTNGKKIKVGVPVKKGFLNFVKVDKTDPMTNETTPTGYTIDIFEAALKKLPYSVVPQYFAFDSDENYNELVKQVYDGVFDAVVGDVTITSHRSLIVDFTLPFTESGVSMLVPLRDNKNKNPWVFLEPWSLDLWLTTGCFFVLIGFVVWLFEHRVNNDFRGPPHHQIGTSFWFSFSTMVFAHREKVVSNLARFVVVVWCFVMLVLTQSYTANLTSFLTVQQLQPTAINVNDLIKNGDSVGFQHDSFVYDILIDLGFQKSKLIPFNTAEECNDLLSKGTSKGGISAAFDEVAYLKAILSKFCSKYAMVEPSFKTAGFGFAFPKNSPLTGDISRAILNVTQSDEMKNIEKQWSMKQRDCPDPKTTLSSNRLSLSSFWGLFLIAGVASFLALLLFVTYFLYEHRHTLCNNDSECSMWRKLTFLCSVFDEKDEKSHHFKNSAVHNVSSTRTPSPSTVQIMPWPQSEALNRGFEQRIVSFISSEEHFTSQSIQSEDGESDIEGGSEQWIDVEETL